MARLLEVRYVRSGIGRPPRQRRTLAALGLKKLNDRTRHNDTATIRGMVNSVQHLVVCEELEEGTPE